MDRKPPDLRVRWVPGPPVPGGVLGIGGRGMGCGGRDAAFTRPHTW